METCLTRYLRILVRIGFRSNTFVKQGQSLPTHQGIHETPNQAEDAAHGTDVVASVDLADECGLTGSTLESDDLPG